MTIRLVAHPEIGKDKLFIQPELGASNKERAERELVESHNRERFASKFHYADMYAGNTRTFDPEGRYNCGRCNQAEGKECLLLGEALKLDLEAGSCGLWENLCGGDPELDFGVKGVATAEEIGYGAAANGVGFGCKRCPYHEKAKEPDSQGRDQYCRKGDFRIFPNACCALNDAKLKTDGNKPEDKKNQGARLMQIS